MAKTSRHFVKQQQPQKYISDKEKRILICVGAALIVIIAAIFLVSALTNETIAVKNGALVGTEDNWIIANAGKGGEQKYYKYGEYDFSDYNGEVVPEKLSYDENSTAVRLYPISDDNVEGFVYATARPAKEVAESVSIQMAGMLNDGQSSAAEEFGDGYIYWYTTTEETQQDDGTTANTYIQAFSCYLPADHNGSIIVRVTYRFDSPDLYVDEDTGHAAINEIIRHIKY